MRYFTPNSKVKELFGNQGVNIDITKDILLFLSTTTETFILKIKTEGYHLEVIDLIDIPFDEIYDTQTGYIIISNSSAYCFKYEELFDSESLIQSTRSDISELLISQ